MKPFPNSFLPSIIAGEHFIRGLSNADICTSLEGSLHLRDLANNPQKQSAKVSLILSRFHTHKLIAKIPRTRRFNIRQIGGNYWTDNAGKGRSVGWPPKTSSWIVPPVAASIVSSTSSKGLMIVISVGKPAAARSLVFRYLRLYAPSIISASMAFQVPASLYLGK
jgi:hypothetical protein